MPITSIISQPATSSINAAYRPTVLEVTATNTDSTARPPVVYCDIYIASVFYKTLSKTQPLIIGITDTTWYFDIQDACQEVLLKQIGANGGGSIITTTSLFASVFCKFRSSGYDANGFILSEDTAPIQATGTIAATSGTGTTSNTFFVINSALQHQNNQGLALHLNAYKSGTWNATTYPLTHRTDNYRVCPLSSDYFPIFSNSVPNCIAISYRNRGETGYTAASSCGGGGGCNAVSFSGIPNLPNGVVGTPYTYSFGLIGDTPFTLSGITKPTWMVIGVSGSTVTFSGTPTATGTAIAVSFSVNNCGGSVAFADTFNVTAACVNASFTGGMQSLPDATIGQPYVFSFGLTGTAPFTLGTIVKPAWMAISVSGSTVSFSGTPTALASGVAVSFNVLNCAAAVLPFTGTINVVTATADLTFQFFHSGSSFLSFSVSLSETIDASVNVSRMFADGFAAGDTTCISSAVASAQFNAVGGNMVILAGQTGASHDPDSAPSGDWSLAVKAVIYNVLLNGSSVINGDVVTLGSYQVTIHIQTCS